MPDQTGIRCYWQRQLEEYCESNKLAKPVYKVFSDRRGGRTAWSSSVIVSGKEYAARCWYDGDYLDNAKEDASELALKTLNIPVRDTAPVSFKGRFDQ